jgi:hypothetical protein
MLDERTERIVFSLFSFTFADIRSYDKSTLLKPICTSDDERTNYVNGIKKY